MESPPAMTFSDEDLKLWKSRKYNTTTFKALLHRLECAERICRLDARHSPTDPDIKAWLTSAGKDPTND